MKPALLVLSLVANITLAAVLFTGKSHVAGQAGGAGQSASGSSLPGATNASPAVEATGLSPGEAAKLAHLWPAGQATDYLALVNFFRAQGFPPAMLRAIVRSQANEIYFEKYRALVGPDAEVPYWKNPSSYSDPKRMAKLRELSREHAKQMRDLLGADAEADSVSDYVAVGQQRRFGDLPAGKVTRAQEVLDDYNQMTSEIYMTAQAAGGGLNAILLPEDREKLAYLKDQERRDLAKILSAEELLEYDLRSSSTANQLRRQLVGFNPSEEEFRAIFKLQQAMDERLGTQNGAGSIDQFQARQAALKELEGQVQAVIAPESFAAYKQATDPRYQQLNRLVARLELPAAAAVEISAIQRDIQQRANAVRTNQAVPAEERTAQVAALVQEAETKLSGVLRGQRGLDAYKQYGGGWMQTLQRPPTRPPGTP